MRVHFRAFLLCQSVPRRFFYSVESSLFTMGFTTIFSKIFQKGQITIKDQKHYERHIAFFGNRLASLYRKEDLSKSQIAVVMEAYCPDFSEDNIITNSGVVSSDSGCDEKVKIEKSNDSDATDYPEFLVKFVFTGQLLITTENFNELQNLIKKHPTTLSHLKEGLNQFETNYGKPADVENCTFEHVYCENSHYKRMFENFPKNSEALLLKITSELEETAKLNLSDINESLMNFVCTGHGHFESIEDIENCFQKSLIFKLTPITECLSDFLCSKLNFKIKPSKELVETACKYRTEMIKIC